MLRYLTGPALILCAVLSGCYKRARPLSAASELRSVVLVEVARQTPSATDPWTRPRVTSEQHLGTVIRGADQKLYILVTGWAVKDMVAASMKKYETRIPVPLYLCHRDENSNLALLSPDNEDELLEMPPLELSQDLPQGTKVSLFTDYNASRLQQHQGHISAIDIYEGIMSSYQVPHYLLKVDKKATGWSEPVIHEGKLAGISSARSSDYVFTLPSMLISRFVSSSTGPEKSGFPEPGIVTRSLIAPDLRTFLMAGNLKGGCRVVHVEEDSPFFGKILPGDILTEASGYQIDRHQNYRHPVWGDLPWVTIYNQMSSGDLLSVKIFRKGKYYQYSEPIKEFQQNNSLIRRGGEEAEPWLILGGLIIRELSLNYLRSWGANWEEEAKSNFLYLWNEKNRSRSTPERVLFVSKVLSDPITLGYEELSNQIILSVNNHQQPKNIEDFKKALQDPVIRNGHKFITLELAGGSGKVILFRDRIREANARIAARYHIHQKEHFAEISN